MRPCYMTSRVHSYVYQGTGGFPSIPTVPTPAGSARLWPAIVPGGTLPAYQGGGIQSYQGSDGRVSEST